MDTTPKAGTDAMRCRACGNEERASEGYPCAGCGTFICLPCTFRGVTRCRTCGDSASDAGSGPASPPSPPGTPA
jgi:hypothetical protein